MQSTRRMAFDPASRSRLGPKDVGRFPSASLFDRIGRTVCGARCLPRKELYEAWEVARRVRRLFRGGRIVDLGGGHGLLAMILLVLDDTSPEAVVVDTAPAPSGPKLFETMATTWPRLAGRVRFITGEMAHVPIAETDLVVSSHACGHLTDRVLSLAGAAGARVAVLPCCHHLDRGDTGSLDGWVDGALAIDVVRAIKLGSRGYRVWTQAIPSAITPKNRLLIGERSRG